MEFETALADHFAAWQTYYGSQGNQFVKDGVIGAYCDYARSPKRLLFLLKEPHDRNGVIAACGRDLRQLFRHPERFGQHRKTTERRIARWASELWGLMSPCCRPATEPIRSIAVMNLKKLPGGSTIADSVLHEVVRRDCWFILKQIRLLNPQVIVCGGTFRFLRRVQPEWEPVESSGLVFRREEALLLDHHHPSARATVGDRHYKIMAALRELTSSPSATPSPTSPSARPNG